MAHQPFTQTLRAVFLCNGEVVDPAPMAFISGHDAARDRAVAAGDRNEDVGRSVGARAFDIATRVVPGPHQPADAPEFRNAVLVPVADRADSEPVPASLFAASHPAPSLAPVLPR